VAVHLRARIRQVGAETARALASTSAASSGVRAADEAALAEVPGIGPTIAPLVAGFFAQPESRRVIDRCFERGLELTGTDRPSGARWPG